MANFGVFVDGCSASFALADHMARVCGTSKRMYSLVGECVAGFVQFRAVDQIGRLPPERTFEALGRQRATEASSSLVREPQYGTGYHPHRLGEWVVAVTGGLCCLQRRSFPWAAPGPPPTRPKFLCHAPYHRQNQILTALTCWNMKSGKRHLKWVRFTKWRIHCTRQVSNVCRVVQWKFASVVLITAAQSYTVHMDGKSPNACCAKKLVEDPVIVAAVFAVFGAHFIKVQTTACCSPKWLA